MSRAEYKVFKSPDEWATTKQACRDKRVVRLNLFRYLIYIYIYIYIYIFQIVIFILYLVLKNYRVFHIQVAMNNMVHIDYITYNCKNFTCVKVYNYACQELM